MNIEQLKQLYPDLGEYVASHLNKAEATTATPLPQTEQGETYQGGIWSDAHCNDFQQGKEESVAESAVEAFDQLEAREEETI